MNKAAQAAERPAMSDSVTSPITSTDQAGAKVEIDKLPFVHINKCHRETCRRQTISISWTLSGSSVNDVVRFDVEITRNGEHHNKIELPSVVKNYHFTPEQPGKYLFRVIPILRDGKFGRDDKSDEIIIKRLWSRNQMLIAAVIAIFALLLIIPIAKWCNNPSAKDHDRVLDERLKKEAVYSLNPSAMDDPAGTAEAPPSKPNWQLPTNPPAPPPQVHDERPHVVIQPPRPIELRPAERIPLSRPEPAEDWEVATKSITAPPADFIITNEVTYVIIKPGKSVAVNVSRQKLLEHTYHANLLVWWDGIEAPAPNKDGIRRFRMSDRPEVVTLKNNGEGDVHIIFVWRILQTPF